jgi:hypothetical protein
MQVDGWQRWGDLMSSGPARPLELDDAERSRLAAAADNGANGEATIVLESMEGDRPGAGGPKRDRNTY